MRVATVRVALLSSLLLLACKAKERPPSGARAVPRDRGGAFAADARPVAGIESRVSGARVAATPLTAPVIYADHAIILPAGADPAVVRRAVERELAVRNVPVIDAPPALPPTGLVAQVVSVTPAQLGFDPVALDYFGRGLGDADRAGLAAATQALAVSVAGPPSQIAEVQHAGAEIAIASGRATSGWIVDQWTGETFTLAAFEAARPPGFPLDVRQLAVAHVVRDEGSTVFLETRGLNRFGVPELFLRGIPGTFADGMLELVNAAAQTLMERRAVSGDGSLEVTLAALQTAGWAETAAQATSEGGTGRIVFEAVWSQGDHAEPGAEPGLIELLLPGDGDVPARAYAALRTTGDPERGAAYAENEDAELLAARDRARKAFAALAPHFADGVPELEHLRVKAPFKVDAGGLEWMWIEVERWEGGVLTGTLLNEPFAPAGVHAGDRVEVKASEIFDYEHATRHGKVAGGETNRIIERRQPAP